MNKLKKILAFFTVIAIVLPIEFGAAGASEIERPN